MMMCVCECIARIESRGQVWHAKKKKRKIGIVEREWKASIQLLL